LFSKAGFKVPTRLLDKVPNGRFGTKSLQMDPNVPEGPFGFICTLSGVMGVPYLRTTGFRRKQRAAGVIVVTM